MTSSGWAKSGSTTLAPSKSSNNLTPPLGQSQANISTSSSPDGFFTSVLYVAQNAANMLSNNIGRGNSASSSRQKTKGSIDSEVLPTAMTKATEIKKSAVKTLGMGDLSLEHLGSSENRSGTNLSIGQKHQDNARERLKSAHDDKNTELSRNDLNYSIPNSDSSHQLTAADDNPSLFCPRTAYEFASATTTGDQNLPNESGCERNLSSRRSNSSRSGVSYRRKRGGSCTNNSTITGPAYTATNNSTARLTQATPKITGFAVASKKRNKDFHQLFRSVPDDDYLIEDYSCALQREILAHGRLYVSEGHLCFSSNILGWITTLVMSFDEIVSVEKRSTALVFKNGLMITTLHAKNVFASFTSRDSTYDLIVGIWKLSHPGLRSSIVGARITDIGGSDKTEKDDGNTLNGSQSDSDLICEAGEDDYEEEDDVEEEEKDIYEDGRDRMEDQIRFNNAEGSVTGSDVSPGVVTSQAPYAATTNCAPGETVKDLEVSRSTSLDFPGPLTHAPTECSDVEYHYPKVVADDIIPAPLGKVWSLAFGSKSYAWFQNFLTVDQKCFDFIREENAKKPLSLENRVRNFTYIKPLNAAIGPRQTKCICVETLELLDFEKSISVTLSTQTPDVPSGSVFCTKTRYCFTWAPNNSTKLLMTYLVEWTGKSWLKGQQLFLCIVYIGLIFLFKVRLKEALRMDKVNTLKILLLPSRIP